MLTNNEFILQRYSKTVMLWNIITIYTSLFFIWILQSSSVSRDQAKYYIFYNLIHRNSKRTAFLNRYLLHFYKHLFIFLMLFYSYTVHTILLSLLINVIYSCSIEAYISLKKLFLLSPNLCIFLHSATAFSKQVALKSIYESIQKLLTCYPREEEEGELFTLQKTYQPTTEHRWNARVQDKQAQCNQI